MSRTSKTKVHTAADGTEFVSVTIKLPRLMHDELERIIRAEDTDRSKFIRRSVVDRLKEEFDVKLELEPA